MQRVCLVLMGLACGGQATGYSSEDDGPTAPPSAIPPAFRERATPTGQTSPRGSTTGSAGGSAVGAAASGGGGHGGTAANPSRGSAAAALPEPPRLLPPACDSLRRLDPNDVYLIGTVQEGSCGYDALAHWSDANVALAGFGCYNSPAGARIRTSDRALLISDTASGVTIFHEDACVTREDGWFGSGQQPLANDGQVASPCSMPSAYYDNLLAVAPSGAMAFWCGSGWFSSSGQMLYVGSRDVLAFDGVRLLTRESLVDTAAHTEQRLVLPDAPVLTARVTSDGFWLVLQNGDPGAAELWHVARAGAAQLLGSYPAPPADATIQYSSRLAGDGALFQLATDAGSGHVRDLIVRRTLAGAAEVVYDEADEPLVRIHGSGLVTGP